MTTGLADLGRIPLDLRIGVTGHRWISSLDTNANEVVRGVLTELIERRPTGSMTATPFGVTIVSALAEGADRLVAKQALELGARLEAVLPMPEADYERDFHAPESLAEFRGLLDASDVVDVVEGEPGRADRYRGAGIAMSDRIDVLVALHDGDASRGTGGTAEIVAYARSVQVPVIDIRAERDDSGTVRLTPPAELPATAGHPLTPEALRKFDRFNAESLQRREQQSARAALRTDADHPWLAQYVRGDLLARRFQANHVRGVRAIYVAAVLAVVSIAVQLAFANNEEENFWAVCELVFLVVVAGAVVVARTRDWLGRWTSARFIAERLRTAMALADIGVVPAFAVVPGGDGAGADTRQEWSTRALRELWFRTQRNLSDSVDAAAIDRVRSTWLDEQVGYHERTAAHAGRIRRVSTWSATVLFGVSLVAAALHLSHVWADGQELLVFVSIVAPTVTAAIAGYSAQREYARVEQRSFRSAHTLARLSGVLEAAASMPDLRALATQLEALVYSEAADWVMSTRLHEPEPA